MPRFSSGSGSGSGSGVTIGFILLISRSSFWAFSSCSFSFSTASLSRSRARSDKVVSKVMIRSPFFTLSPGWTKISVTVWVSDRKTVCTRSVVTGP